MAWFAGGPGTICNIWSVSTVTKYCKMEYYSIDRANPEPWSRIRFLSYWRLAQHSATLPKRPLHSMYSTMAPSRRPHFALGIETSSAFQVQRFGTCCEPQALGSTLWLFHHFAVHKVTWFTCLSYSFDSFCARALHWRASLTWPACFATQRKNAKLCRI